MRRVVFLLLHVLLHLQLSAQDAATPTPTSDSVFVQKPEYQYAGNINPTDSVIRNARNLATQVSRDSTQKIDTTYIKKPAKKRPIETTIHYTAQDSMIFDLENQRLHLYGKTHMDYGDIGLDADQTSIDWVDRNIQSNYTVDSTGRKRGKPVFTDRSDVYEMDDILYNFSTKRAIIKGVVTEQDGAFMHGEDVKKNEVDELFIRGAKYTTCNLSDPHFFIESKKLKAIPGNKVVSGPFNLKFREVPTPLWFPFGMFPQPREKASGIIFPSYGEETRRGFFLRDGGYYFAISDYVDLRVSGDIYSKGGHAVNANTNYKVRYKFNGSLNFSYIKNVTENIEDPSITKDYWLRWSHRPESRGNQSFSASVSAGTSSYNNNNNLANQDFQRSINSQFSSNVSYSKRFSRVPVNMSLNGRQSQNVATGIYNITLPDMTLNVNRIYPLEGLIKSSKSPLAKLSFSYNFVAKNEFSNAPLRSYPFNVVNTSDVSRDTLDFDFNNLSAVYDRSKIGGRHSIPISTSFNVLKYFTMSPSFNYNEVWFTRELDYKDYDPVLGGVVVDTLEQFSRAGSWTSGASMNTRIYGMYYTRGLLGIDAIRHVMTPSVSFSYNPDFSSSGNGVYKDLIIDSLGTTRRVSKYDGFAYAGPSGTENKSLGFSLTNNLEMKIRTKKDSVNEFKKVKIFDNLSMSTGYNFAADSFQLSNINWNARTSFFKQTLNLTLSGNFDPYVYADDGSTSGRRLDRYAWNNGQGLGTLQTLNTAVTFSLKPKGSKDKNQSTPQNPNNEFGTSPFDNPNLIENNQFGTPDDRAYVMQNADEYVDFSIPWSLNVSYNVNRTKRGLDDAAISSHGFQVRGTLGLTGKTQITFNTGYDLKNKDFTQTRIGVDRDLHCWSLNFGWVPFGRFQSFNLTIRPKSSLLQDLKLERRRNFFDFF